MRCSRSWKLILPRIIKEQINLSNALFLLLLSLVLPVAAAGAGTGVWYLPPIVFLIGINALLASWRGA